MANPQKENGHVPVANELVEALARVRIPGEASQVLWALLRLTYGWNKKEDHIKLCRLMELTGLKKPTVCRALSKMITMCIIIKKDNDLGTIWGLQKNYDLWQPLSKKIMNVIKKDNKTLSKKITPTTTQNILKHSLKQVHANVIKKDNDKTLSKKITPNPLLLNEPTPKTLTPIQQVVEAYKAIKGYDKVPGWDKKEFARCSKDAKDILGFVEGDVSLAIKGTKIIGAYFKAKHLTWFLCTVAKHFPEYLSNPAAIESEAAGSVRQPEGDY